MARPSDPENSQYFEPLAVAVASGQRVCHAANEVGCSVSYGYDLSRTPQFCSRVSQYRTAAVVEALGLLTEASVNAVSTLAEAMADTPRPDAWIQQMYKCRLPAAKAALNLLLPLSDNLELRQRLDQLEQAAQERAESERAA